MLTAKQQKALEGLIFRNTRKAAAEYAGIDAKTLRSYFKKEEFVEAYREAFSVKVDEATRIAQKGLLLGIKTLIEVCQDKEAGTMARVSASRSLLEYGIKLSEHNDLAARVAELERLAAEE